MCEPHHAAALGVLVGGYDRFVVGAALHLVVRPLSAAHRASLNVAALVQVS